MTCFGGGHYWTSAGQLEPEQLRAQHCDCGAITYGESERTAQAQNANAAAAVRENERANQLATEVARLQQENAALSDRVAFVEQIQNKLQTLKSDAPTWKAAIIDRIEHYLAAEAQVAALQQTLAELRTWLEARHDEEQSAGCSSTAGIPVARPESATTSAMPKR